MEITHENRLDAYRDIVEKRELRRNEILTVMSDIGPATAEEITEEMWRRKLIPAYDKNFCAPRLTEMKAKKTVKVTGKKPSKRTGKNIAIWEVVS